MPDFCEILQDSRVFCRHRRAAARHARLCSAVAQNTVMAWQLSTVGDAYGSHAATSGDVGTPGSFVLVNCAAGDAIFSDGFETP